MACSDENGGGKGGRNDGGSMREFLKLLAKKGFDVNDWKNQAGQTPLHACTEEGELDMVERLFEVKADVNIKDQAGHTPLWSAARFGRANIAALLLKHGAKTHPGIFALHEAGSRGHADIVAVLLQAGSDALELDASGFTPARISVLRPKGTVGEMDARLKKGKAEALSIILQGGGDLTELINGFSLLHSAAGNDLLECISVVVERGLDPNTPSDNDDKRTPLHTACWYGSVNAIKELCRLGAAMDAVDTRNGFSPIFEAVMRGHDACVTTMIDLGASIVAKDKQGFTPLHAAAAAGQVKCAYLLLEAGAPVSGLSDEGHSPLMVCMKPELLPGLKEGYAVDNGSKEERTRVARLFMEMDAHVCGEVVKYAAEEEMNEALADSMMQLRNTNRTTEANSITIGNTLLKESDEVVYVSLVDKNTGEVGEQRCKLNTQLVQYLAKGQKEEGEHASSAPTADDTAPSNVLSTLLDPGSRGFKEGEGTGTPGDVKEVKLSYDGSDFTKEGFGVVVAYLTTGRVNHLLVNKPSAAKRGGGGKGDGANDRSHSGGDEGGGSSASRKRKRTTTEDGSPSASKGRCLFDGKLAGKALQAAGYFCLEGMTVEVKRLMDIYGFAIEEETNNAPAPVIS